MPMKKDHPEDVTLLRTQLMSLVRRLRRESRSDEKSWAQLMLLGAIDRHGGEATPSLLAESERMRSSNLAAALRELEADGLLVRTPDAEDKRRVRVRLTPAGLGLLQQSRSRREAWLLAAMESCLTEREQALLIEAGALMARLAAAPSTETE
ncbi:MULTISPECIES: MarR family winged helix-turn-helix transcriptional regulator [Serratia]|uniref:MarR family winged helix-turn-helix transcriptional regulator n=1 Tax=Serratia TaxID=613 RepID=UPI000413136E|nr:MULTISPECIES: MarR family transcriptional regulator [Serratia]MDF8316193.1 winged helix DNA-binding protein [Serratia nevei]UBI64432.1 winged helix DNA-binding protein [Serratia sp. HRI]